MKIYKAKSPELNTVYNEHMQIIKEIASDIINNVCFECGKLNPEYISLNNGIFLCSKCVIKHYKFPTEISIIIRNDFNLLTLNELKNLFFGGNKKLIEFINFEFPQLKHCPPFILYKTTALEFYRKRLKYFVEGGIKPIKPSINEARQLINYNFSEIKNNSSELSPIIEKNIIEDESEKTLPLTYNKKIKNNLINNNKIITEEINFNDQPAYSVKKISFNNSDTSSYYTCNSETKVNNITPYKKHIAKFVKKGKLNNISKNLTNDFKTESNSVINSDHNINKIKNIKINNVPKNDNSLTIKEININTQNHKNIRKSKSMKYIDVDNSINSNQEMNEQNIKENKQEKTTYVEEDEEKKEEKQNKNKYKEKENKTIKIDKIKYKAKAIEKDKIKNKAIEKEKIKTKAIEKEKIKNKEIEKDKKKNKAAEKEKIKKKKINK